MGLRSDNQCLMKIKGHLKGEGLQLKKHLTNPQEKLPFSASDLVIQLPDVSHHGVGARLQVPGGQSQTGTERLHVCGRRHGRQSVVTPAEDEVPEGSLDGGQVWREEAMLHLRRGGADVQVNSCRRPVYNKEF